MRRNELTNEEWAISTAPAGDLSGFDCGSRIDAFGALTGRIGYALDQAPIYARGGLTWDRQSKCPPSRSRVS